MITSSYDKILTALSDRHTLMVNGETADAGFGDKKELAAHAGVSLRTVSRQLPRLLANGMAFETHTKFGTTIAYLDQGDVLEAQRQAEYDASKAEQDATPVSTETESGETSLTPAEMLLAMAPTVQPTEPTAPADLPLAPSSDPRASSVPRTRERAILTLIASDDPMSLNDIVAGLAAAGDTCSPTTVKTTTYLIRRLGWLSREGAKGDFSVTEAGHAALGREKAAPKPRTARKSYKSRVEEALAYVATVPNQQSDIVEALRAILAP